MRRQLLLDEAFITYQLRGDLIASEFPLATGQKVVFDFVRNPTTPVDFSKLSADLGRRVLAVHSAFWDWKLGR